jgi:hypothetical protein
LYDALVVVGLASTPLEFRVEQKRDGNGRRIFEWLAVVAAVTKRTLPGLWPLEFELSSIFIFDPVELHVHTNDVGFRAPRAERPLQHLLDFSEKPSVVRTIRCRFATLGRDFERQWRRKAPSRHESQRKTHGEHAALKWGLPKAISD